jgi:flagellar biosynthesis GTPase FlhF
LNRPGNQEISSFRMASQTDLQKTAEHLQKLGGTLDFVAQLVMREPMGIQEEEANYQNVKSQLDSVAETVGPKGSLAQTLEKLVAKGNNGGIYGPTTVERIAGLKQRFDLLQTRTQELSMVADCQHFDWVERNAAEIARQTEQRIQRETEQRQVEAARLAKETAEREAKEREDAAILEKIRQQEEEKKAKQRAKAKEKKKKQKEKQKKEEAERAAQQARLNEMSKEERLAAEEDESDEDATQDAAPTEPETYGKEVVSKGCVTISVHELPKACYSMEYTQHAIEGSAKCVLVPVNQGDTAPPHRNLEGTSPVVQRRSDQRSRL